METKPVRASRTLRGLLLVFLPLLQNLWVELDIKDIIEMGNQIDQMVLIATQLVGIILAIYGRFKAKKELVLTTLP